MEALPTISDKRNVTGAKAYGTDAALGMIERAGALVVSHSNSNQESPLPFDRET